MTTTKIAFRLITEGPHTTAPSLLPMLQHMQREGFDFTNLKEDGLTQLYSEGDYELCTCTYIQAFSESLEMLRQFTGSVQWVSQYFHRYASDEKDVLDGYPEMEAALMQLYRPFMTEHVLSPANGYCALELTAQDLSRIKDTVHGWIRDEKHIA